MPHYFEFDRVHQILRARIEGVIGDEEVIGFKKDMTNLFSELNPKACIVDFSETTKYQISSEQIRAIGRTSPALPNVSVPVVVVAPAPHIFGATRMFQMTAEEKRPWIHVVRSVDEAYRMLKVDSLNFEPLPEDAEGRARISKTPDRAG